MSFAEIISTVAETSAELSSGASEVSCISDSLLSSLNDSLGSVDEIGCGFSETAQQTESLIERANESLGNAADSLSISDNIDLNADVKSNEFNSTYKERLDRTPVDGPRGCWTGERGESSFVPSYQYMKDYLENKFEISGIEYKNAIPDFSPCSESTVEIDNMSSKRYGPDGNFSQCDTKCAEQWNNESRDGKTDWTPRDVAEWREENKYSWHERNDMKTCDLIPTKINDYFGHLGGVSECKKSESLSISEGDFDE